MKLIGYIRVSSTGQLDGDGPDRQEFAIRAFCIKHNIELFNLRVEALTGKSDGFDRPVFSDIAKQIAQSRHHPQPIDGIVVEKIDRLARDLMVSEVLLRECRKLKIKVFSADQGAPIDVSGDEADPTRIFVRQILGAVAEYEKSALVKKLREARNRMKAKTGRCDGQKPYGHYPGEQNILKLVHGFREQGHTWEKIATLLNDADFCTRYKKQWTERTVRNIAKKP